jgi:hypothetical protein
MRKALMIASLTAFVAVSAVAAPRRDLTPPPSSSEEVAGNPGDDQGTVSNFTQTVDDKVQDCGCPNTNKPKRAKR